MQGGCGNNRADTHFNPVVCEFLSAIQAHNVRADSTCGAGPAQGRAWASWKCFSAMTAFKQFVQHSSEHMTSFAYNRDGAGVYSKLTLHRPT